MIEKTKFLESNEKMGLCLYIPESKKIYKGKKKEVLGLAPKKHNWSLECVS